jgi:hypothetical protein
MTALCVKSALCGIAPTFLGTPARLVKLIRSDSGSHRPPPPSRYRRHDLTPERGAGFPPGAPFSAMDLGMGEAFRGKIFKAEDPLSPA